MNDDRPSNARAAGPVGFKGSGDVDQTDGGEEEAALVATVESLVVHRAEHRGQDGSRSCFDGYGAGPGSGQRIECVDHLYLSGNGLQRNGRLARVESSVSHNARDVADTNTDANSDTNTDTNSDSHAITRRDLMVESDGQYR